MAPEMINSADLLARSVGPQRLDHKAIVLRINSPGGSALGSDMILREVKLAAEQITDGGFDGNLAASGGYYLACAADTIVAIPTTLTGSIGVFGLIPNLQNLLEKKLGINSDVVKTNKLSDMPSTTRPLTTVEKAQLQNMVENVYSTFVNHVAEGRA
jgi:protease-4